MNCNCKNCGAPFTCGKFGAHVKKFCTSRCRKQFHDTGGRRMTTTATTTTTTMETTNNISKSIGNSLANRALRPAMSVIGAATGLGVVGSVGAGVAADVVGPIVKDGISKGKIKPLGTIVGGFLGYMATKDIKSCKTNENGLKTDCKKNYIANGSATLLGSIVGNFIELKIRNNWSSPLTTTPTTVTTETIAPKPNLMEGINIDDLMKMVFKSYNMKGDFWGLVLGETVSDPFNVIAYGTPGSGKTTMSLKFADYFGRKFGKVKYLSAEMGVTDGLKKMVQRVGMKSKKVFFDSSKKELNELINELKRDKYKMLIIDSANFAGYSPEDLETIKEQVKGLSTFVILQSTKDGKFKGNNDYAHNADVILKIDDLEVYTEKTRYAAKNLAGMPFN